MARAAWIPNVSGPLDRKFGAGRSLIGPLIRRAPHRCQRGSNPTPYVPEIETNLHRDVHQRRGLRVSLRVRAPVRPARDALGEQPKYDNARDDDVDRDPDSPEQHFHKVGEHNPDGYEYQYRFGIHGNKNGWRP